MQTIVPMDICEGRIEQASRGVMAGSVVDCANCGAKVNSAAIACPSCGGNPLVRDDHVAEVFKAEQLVAKPSAHSNVSSWGLGSSLVGLFAFIAPIPYLTELGLFLAAVGVVLSLAGLSAEKGRGKAVGGLIIGLVPFLILVVLALYG